MTKTTDSATATEQPHPRFSMWPAAGSVATGFLTLVIGGTLALLGMGFGNSSACGTGAAAGVVGIWTVLATRGVLRRSLPSLAGLALAWGWLLIRGFVDWPATASSAVVVLFLLPAVSVPLIVLWIVLVFVCGATGLTHLYRGLRPRSPEGVRNPWSAARLGSLCVRLALLISVTTAAPHLVWRWRGNQIAALAREYATKADRKSWPTDYGACSMVFLGYELTQHGAESVRDPTRREAIYQKTLSDAEAELKSIATAGARYVRAGASGDQLLQPNPDQERLDDCYIAAVRRTGRKLVLVDTQHPKVLQKQKLDWPAFCRFQRERIEYYQRRYHPEVYQVVCEPMSYHHFALRPATTYSAADWSDQLSAMCRLVKSIDSATRTGICLLVMGEKESEWEVWTRMQQLPELDILSVEIYSPENFRQTEERLAKYGHPQKVGKSFWIAETYNGWALNGNRRWDQDAEWLRVLPDFARVVRADTVMVWSFCTFVPGSSFWDFGGGRLSRLWQGGERLSLVGQTFADIAGPLTAPRGIEAAK